MEFLSDPETTRPWGGGVGAVPAGPGETLGTRYQLREPLGRGGTATVHRAWDDLLHREVAIKVFDRRAGSATADEDRRLVEMQALAAVDHTGLVAVYDAGVADPADPDTATYLVMELVPGTTLAERLADGPVPEPLVRSWGRTLADALHEVHAAGLVHRDVKPANVLVGAADSVKLGDFGLARNLYVDARITPGADVLGTPAYLSPEQATGDAVGPSSDVYSLGLVLLECLTGRREYAGEAISAALARLLRSPEVPTGLPTPWPSLLLAMTARDPAGRPDAATVSMALSGVAGTDIETGPTSARRRGNRASGAAPATLESLFHAPAEPTRRRAGVRLLVTAALVTAAAAAMIGAVVSSGDPDASTPSPQQQVSTPTASTSAPATGGPAVSTGGATSTPVASAPAPASASAAQPVVQAVEPSTSEASPVAGAVAAEPTTQAPAPVEQPVVPEPVQPAPAAAEPVVQDPAPAPVVPPTVVVQPSVAPAPGGNGPGNGTGNGTANGNSGGNGNGNGNGGANGNGSPGNGGGNGNGNGGRNR